MSDWIVDAVRRDLLELVRGLGVHLQAERGGTLARNQEIAAEYLIWALGVEGDDTVTKLMLREVCDFADAWAKVDGAQRVHAPRRPGVSPPAAPGHAR